MATQRTAHRPPKTHSSRRVNQIADLTGASSYLEIGVATGATFFNVRTRTRVAVDPQFQFDPAAHVRRGTRYEAVASDAYFAAGRLEKFDIIFLDGLHTYEQTFRDFCNSLATAHDTTVWLIDDVYPSDVFSTLREQTRAVTARTEAGVPPSRDWHGDIYKVLFTIHDFFPTMNYVTIRDHGNPQALVWRQPRLGSAPSFDSLEQISRLDYFGMREHEHLFKFATETGAWDALRAAFDERASRTPRTRARRPRQPS